VLKTVSNCARFTPVAAAALALAACGSGSRGGPIPYDVQNFGRPDPPSMTSLEQGYRIGPLDKLEISVFQVEDLSGEFEVDLLGNVSMPLIGDVKAIDLTAGQLEAALAQKLSEKYLQNPDVNVAIKSSTRSAVTVDGAVEQPGRYPVAGPTTLLEVIAQARGEADDANPRRVAIFRQIEGKRSAAAFDLTAIRRGQAEDPKVYPGDIVVVDGSTRRRDMQDLLRAIPILGIFNPIL
jgi:polysaccharide export outer membrane protein